MCLSAQKNGWHTCPSKSVPAGEIERFVVQQIAAVGRDHAVLEGTQRQLRQLGAKELADLQDDQKSLERETVCLHAVLRRLASPEHAAPDGANAHCSSARPFG